MAEPTPKPVDSGRDQETLRLETLGAQLLIRLAALIRTARTHDVTNQAFQRQLQDCLAIVQGLLVDEHEATLVAVADQFYVNGVRVRASSGLLPVMHALLAEFERRALGGLRFMESVSAAELERFFQLFIASDDPTLAEQFFEAVETASVSHLVPIRVQQVEREALAPQLDEGTDPASERGRAKRVFWRAVLGTRHIISHAAQKGRPDLRYAKRLVQPVVDSIMDHEYSLVGLTALKDHDEYTYAHCVNVSILSVSMGHALDLPRQTLADLGVAALLHDLGKVAVPGDVLRKPAKLDAREWQLMRRHPLEGTKIMFRMPGLSNVGLDSMRVSLEHHMNIDRSGYPEIAGDWRQCSLSRIVALADCFDAMTAHRAYHRRAFSPFEALQYVIGPGRGPFDRAVLWALVQTVSLYPPGTVLLTASRRMVLSLSPNPEDLTRPHCRVLVQADGQVEPEEGGETWDPMPPEERVVRVLRPEDLSLEVGEYLAA